MVSAGSSNITFGGAENLCASFGFKALVEAESKTETLPVGTKMYKFSKTGVSSISMNITTIDVDRTEQEVLKSVTCIRPKN